jgi:hypothetical protein
LFPFSSSLTIVVATATLWLGWRETQAENPASPGEVLLMLTQNESPALATAPAEVSGTPQKMRQLLEKRLRQLARVTFVLATCVALAATSLTIWWLTSLNGLPDIGDPFDVAAFRAFRVPDEQNAFTFLRRAEETLTPAPPRVELSWSEADPKTRAWVEANHRAIELFQRGAEQSDAANPGGDSVVNGQRLATLVLLEGEKRQARGDTVGAWDCNRAVLRMAIHTRRRGSLHQRQDLDAYWYRLLRQRLATWAADRRTTIPQLRSALEEMFKSEPKPEWDSFAIKAGYLEMMRSLEQPINTELQRLVDLEYTYHLGDMQSSPDWVGYFEATYRFRLREPERSRRVLRLLFANWLAHLEIHEPRPRKPAVWASFSMLSSTNPIGRARTGVPLYPVGPGAPAGARSLPPQEVASWLVSTNDAKLRIVWANNSQWPWSPDRLRDRKAHSDLVIMLATEIYRRERGNLPPSDEALVGTYLKSLPDDGSADVGDETVPKAQ